jgi:hypothetical protein
MSRRVFFLRHAHCAALRTRRVLPQPRAPSTARALNRARPPRAPSATRHFLTRACTRASQVRVSKGRCARLNTSLRAKEKELSPAVGASPPHRLRARSSTAPGFSPPHRACASPLPQMPCLRTPLASSPHPPASHRRAPRARFPASLVLRRWTARAFPSITTGASPRTVPRARTLLHRRHRRRTKARALLRRRARMAAAPRARVFSAKGAGSSFCARALSSAASGTSPRHLARARSPTPRAPRRRFRARSTGLGALHSLPDDMALASRDNAIGLASDGPMLDQHQLVEMPILMGVRAPADVWTARRHY